MPIGGSLTLSKTLFPNLELFNHHKNQTHLDIKVSVTEKDIIYDDHGSINSHLQLNIKEGYSDHSLKVNVKEGRRTAQFIFGLSVTDIRSLTFQTLWENHPARAYPCDQSTFKNQCAIRMGVALEKSGIDTSSFDTLYPGRRCWLGHTPGHILAAQELANWIHQNPDVFGTRQKIEPHSYPDQSGIIFIKNGWGATDHIDVWDGSHLKGGDPTYIGRGEEVWFWKI